MANKPKPQVLRDRIEKTQSNDGLDSDLESHYNELISSLKTIGPLEPFNLLTPESAREAIKLCNANLEKLNRIGKQIKAVNYLMKERRGAGQLSIDNLPWPDPDKPSNKKTQE